MNKKRLTDLRWLSMAGDPPPTKPPIPPEREPDDGDDEDDIPETPPTEPPPQPIVDPLPEGSPEGPFVVGSVGACLSSAAPMDGSSC
jgi:hypothetical protein